MTASGASAGSVLSKSASANEALNPAMMGKPMISARSPERRDEVEGSDGVVECWSSGLLIR